jgi:DNA-directed RNA polymerase specialized sigma24 family protein
VTPDFADFYRDAKDDCLRTLVISTGDRELAQDLVAEAFARACASWRKVARHPNPKAWVIRTALNVHTDRWRRRRRETLLGHPEDVGMNDADPADPAIIGISPGTVKSHLFRALAALREDLKLKEQIL